MTELAVAGPSPEPDIPVIRSDPDSETKPFAVEFLRAGEWVQETFRARVSPPFSVFGQLRALEAAAPTNNPERINEAVRKLLRTAMPWEDSTRLLTLIEGDADEVGVITPDAIGGVVDFLRTLYLRLPTPPNSSSGQSKRVGGSSGAGRSGKASTSTRSRRKTA